MPHGARMEEIELLSMNLTINLPEAGVQVLEAKATACGISAEQYALQVLERDLAPDWLRESWAAAADQGLDQLSMDEIDTEIASARHERRVSKPQTGA